MQALAFKAIRGLYPDYPLWRDLAYEYEYEYEYEHEHGKLAIDDAGATPGDLEAVAARDEEAWLAERASFLIY